MRFITLLAGTVVLSGALGATACAQQRRPAPTPAPTPQEREDEDRERTFVRSWSDDSDRAVLGVSTASSSSERDTLGVLISSVTPGGPAEKAGLEEGNRIAAVNGVNLRLSPADAGEDDMRGIASRRLTREMRKVKAGDEVSLRVYAAGAFRDVRVRTVAADSLSPRRVRVSRAERREQMENRAVLGLNLSATGSRRDTLGPMVVRVESDGPAEKAGVVEGDRVQSVNGVDLRVSREDAGDDFVANARLNRFRRTLREIKPGDRVELRVISGGQARTVQVTAVRARDLYKDGERRAFFFEGGEGMFFPGPMGAALAPVPPTPPMAPMPPMAPRVRVAPRVRTFELDHLDGIDHFEFDMGDHFEGGHHFELDVDADALRDASEEMRRALEKSRVELRRALDGVRVDVKRARKEARDEAERAREEAERTGLMRRGLRSASADALVNVAPLVSDAVLAGADAAAFAVEPAMTAVLDGWGEGWGEGWSEGAGWGDGWDEGSGDGAGIDGDVMSASGTGDRYTLRLPGLQLAKVTPDLAATLGAGSERGLLVLEASGRWGALRAGDVLLAVNGTPVRDDDRASVRFDLSRDTRVTVVRKGARVELELPAR